MQPLLSLLRKIVRKTLFKLKIWQSKFKHLRNYRQSVLRTVRCKQRVHTRSCKKLAICQLNARSVNNKTHSLHDFIIQNDFDLIAITETWLVQDTGSVTINELVPPTYRILHLPRQDGRVGGGVAVIYKANIGLKLYHEIERYSQFEHLECSMVAGGSKLHLFIVYRTPSSAANNLTNNAFIEEWNSFLEKCTKISSEIVILGDLNVHFDDVSDRNRCSMVDLFHEYGFKQHVQECTHVKDLML